VTPSQFTTACNESGQLVTPSQFTTACSESGQLVTPSQFTTARNKSGQLVTQALKLLICFDLIWTIICHFVLFSFGQYIVCLSIYSFGVTFWHLQTFPRIPSDIVVVVSW
jgi:hypothetical protein